MKIQKKNWGGSVGEGGVKLGGQGGCDRRIEVFGKIHTKKKFRGGSVWGGFGLGGVRVDVNEELKFFVKIKKKKYFFFLGGGGVRVRGAGWM